MSFGGVLLNESRRRVTIDNDGLSMIFGGVFNSMTDEEELQSIMLTNYQFWVSLFFKLFKKLGNF